MFNSKFMSLVNNSSSLNLLYSCEKEVHIEKIGSDYVWVLYEGTCNECIVTRYNKKEDVKERNIQMVGRIYVPDLVISMILAI